MTQASLKSPVEGGAIAQKKSGVRRWNFFQFYMCRQDAGGTFGNGLREENSMTEFGKNSSSQHPAANELWEFSIFIAGQTPAFCRRAGSNACAAKSGYEFRIVVH